MTETTETLHNVSQIYRMGKSRFTVASKQNGLFLYHYLLIFVLFLIETTVYLLLPTPVLGESEGIFMLFLIVLCARDFNKKQLIIILGWNLPPFLMLWGLTLNVNPVWQSLLNLQTDVTGSLHVSRWNSPLFPWLSFQKWTDHHSPSCSPVDTTELVIFPFKVYGKNENIVATKE